MSERNKYHRERDEELTQLYCDLYDKIKPRHIDKRRKVALTTAIKLGSAHYEVSFERAYIIVPKILKGKEVKFRSKPIELMWREIACKTAFIMQTCHLSIAKSLEIVLMNCRSSQFYISQPQAWLRIKRELRRMRVNRKYGRN